MNAKTHVDRPIQRYWPWLLLALAAAFFWRLCLTPDSLIYRPNSDYSDLTITHWPNALFIRQSLAAWGQLPLWRPLILGGEPFAANPLSGLWYPLNLLLLVLPLTPAFNLLFVLHTAWAGAGGYLLSRSLGASPAGALLAALTVMFAPKAVVHLASGHVGLFFAWAWLPWTMWAVRRLARDARPGNVAMAAVAAAMLILADVRLGFYGGVAAGGYWMAHGKFAIRDSNIRNLRPAIRALATALLSASLIAVQFLPLAAVAGRLNRGGLSLAESAIASLPPPYLLGLLLADHGGFQEWMTYVGAPGLLLALVALARRGTAQRGWWGGLALVAGVYSLGTYTPLYGWLYRFLPPLGWLRGPARAWFLLVLALAVLAALGLTALEQAPRPRPVGKRRASRVAAALGGAALAGGVAALTLRLPANVLVAVLLWPLAGTLLALRSGGRLRPPLSTGLLLALALADLWLVGQTLYRVRPAREVLAEGQAAAAWLAEQPVSCRVYSPSYSLPQHTSAFYGLEQADGVDPFQLADYVEWMRTATGVDLPGYSVTVPAFPAVAEDEDMLLAHRDVQPDLQQLGLLNVCYLAAAYPMHGEGLVSLGQHNGVYLYRNEWALPRAFVATRTDWREQGAKVRTLHWTPNRIEVQAQGPGLLVLSEVHDPDWRAEVDGQAVELLRAGEILRGVDLAAGWHSVTLVYRPTGLVAGGALSAAGWLSVIGLGLWEWRKGRNGTRRM